MNKKHIKSIFNYFKGNFAFKPVIFQKPPFFPERIDA